MIELATIIFLFVLGIALLVSIIFPAIVVLIAFVCTFALAKYCLTKAYTLYKEYKNGK